MWRSCMGNMGWLPGSMAHEMPQSPHLYAGWPAVGLGLWHLRTGLRWEGSWGGSFLFSLHSESIHLSMSRRGRLDWLGPDRDLLAFQRAGEMNRRLRCTKIQNALFLIFALYTLFSIVFCCREGLEGRNRGFHRACLDILGTTLKINAMSQPAVVVANIRRQAHED
ncbi:hypothetical protein Ddc_13172 [Ditylenchus destructor]|nr:hypothetical protein Ddc_13172 [Ditylenchus destructor]